VRSKSPRFLLLKDPEVDRSDASSLTDLSHSATAPHELGKSPLQTNVGRLPAGERVSHSGRAAWKGAATSVPRLAVSFRTEKYARQLPTVQSEKRSRRACRTLRGSPWLTIASL
jgi:hypothetical protein